MTVVKIRLLVIIAMLVTSMSVGCTFQSRNPPASTTLQVSMDDVLNQSVVGQNVTLAVGNTLTLKLGSNYSTPYRWTADTKIGDETILKQTSHEFEQPTIDALGAPGTEVWTFKALKRGITTITTYYTSFVGHDSTPKCTYYATVTVK